MWLQVTRLTTDPEHSRDRLEIKSSDLEYGALSSTSLRRGYPFISPTMVASLPNIRLLLYNPYPTFDSAASTSNMTISTLRVSGDWIFFFFCIRDGDVDFSLTLFELVALGLWYCHTLNSDLEIKCFVIAIIPA